MSNATQEIQAFAKKHNLDEATATIVMKEQEKQAAKLEASRKKAALRPHALVGQTLKADFALTNGKVVAKKGTKNEDTLTYDQVARKFKCRIRCTVTGDTSRWVYTSDLHQIRTTKEAHKELKAAAQKKKREETKKALEAFRKAQKK